MKNTSIVFTEPYKIVVQEDEANVKPGDGEILVKKLYSLISTGTELACLSGKEGWFKMPAAAGYSCVSEVCASNAVNAVYKEGDIIFHYGTHSLYQIINEKDFIFPVDTKDNLHLVPVLRMATVASTAIRISDIELGDYVAVSGLGLVGNMASQLAELSGACVIGVDPSEMRRNKAKDCGVSYVVSPENQSEYIRKITGGSGVHTVIEATGIPQVGADMLGVIGYHGEIIFLGTPRGKTMGDLADVFCYSHVDGKGSITFKGAHEWRYPIEKDKFVKHSITRNTEICLDLFKKNKLKIDGLVSHIIKPQEAPAVYKALNENRNDFMGVIFDWNDFRKGI